MIVELVYDKHCPSVALTRASLLRSFVAAGTPARWSEWEASEVTSPDHVHGFGSPTVLIDGRDVAGVKPVKGLMCCRLYENADGTWRGAPASELIVRALQYATGSAANADVPGGHQDHYSQRSLINSRELTKEKKMNNKRRIEIFSAGCPVCEETIALVNRISCSSCEVEVLDMRQPKVALKAKQYGIRSVPAVLINGKLAECCAGRGPEESSLRAGGLGVSLS